MMQERLRNGVWVGMMPYKTTGHWAYRGVLFGCGFFGLCFKERERMQEQGMGRGREDLSRLHAQHGVHQWGLIS